MTESGLTTSDERRGIDPAALAVASLAAAVSVVAPPGPYGPPSLMIGATILAVIFAYDKNPDRKGRSEKFAFSAVCALITLLMLGYPMECIFAAICPEGEWNLHARLAVLIRERENDIKHSQVPPLAVIILWGLMVLGYYHLYPKLKKKS